MKKPFLTLLGFSLAASVTSLPAQGPPDYPPFPKRGPEELAELLGPIALYPDPLISLILPASTVPADIVMAGRFVASAADLAQLDEKPWDSSVRALTRYPETLSWLDDNLEWTAQVGDAFVEQPVDVMESIQALRAKARALGNLVDTPEQRIVQEDADIRILPAQPEYIYEPRYDPEIVYVQRPAAAPLLFFSAAHRIGAWLSYEFDWSHRRLYRGERRDGPDNDRQPRRVDPGRPSPAYNHLSNSREWQPDTARRQSQVAPSPTGAPRRGSPSSVVVVPPSGHDGIRDQSKPSRTGVAKPKPMANTTSHGEVIRKASPVDQARSSDQPPAVRPNVSRPESPLNSRTGRDRPIINDPPGNNPPGPRSNTQKRPGNVESPPAPERTRLAPTQEQPQRKDTPRQDEPQRLGPKQDRPDRREAPKREEPSQRTPQPSAPPRAAPNQPQEQPIQKKKAPKQDAPKHKDKDSPQSSATPLAAPKQDAPQSEGSSKPHSDGPTKKGGKGDGEPDKKKNKKDKKDD